ncbi:MAG: sugar ABC transporter permease [Spirochaetes bacterium]|nr:sugar ABC transporter permease [Spirochaetota bacterium]
MGLLFMLPSLSLLVVFFLFPLTQVLYMSFQDWNVMGSSTWEGINNYIKALGSGEFWLSLWNTFIYTVIVTPLIFVPAILLAVMLKKTTFRTEVMRVVIFIPFTISFVSASYIWSWIYNDTYGILNFLLSKIDLISRPVNWLGETWRARVMISIMVAWKTLGFSMLIFISGLQSISQEIYEAADIDGASRIQTLFLITIPILRPTIFLALVISIAGSFKAFDQFFIMTNGGPMRTTQTIVMYINKIAFENYDMGTGSAVSVLFLILLLSISYQQIRMGGYTGE